MLKMLTLLLIPLVMVVRADDCPKVRTPTEPIHQKIMQSQLQFSADLLKTVAMGSSKNVLLSPASVYYAVLITYFSAGGITSKALRKTLRIPHDKGLYTKGLVIGDYELLKWKIREEETASKKYQLSIANRIYLDDKFHLKKCMKKLFNTEIQLVNFASPGTVVDINSWVSKQTKGMIKNIIPDSDMLSDFAMINTAYFKGTWESKFPSPAMREDFHLANGSTVHVKMMDHTSAFRANLDKQLDSNILELPYKGGDVSMFIILPNKPSVSAISDLLNKITGETLSNAFKMTSKSHPVNVRVNIPKFTVEETYHLVPVLTSMGADALFNGTANFSTLLQNSGGIPIENAIHKTKIRVTEKGTEAAAVTAFTNDYSPYKIRFTANRPFIYAIFDKPLRLLLFTGIFNSP